MPEHWDIPGSLRRSLLQELLFPPGSFRRPPRFSLHSHEPFRYAGSVLCNNMFRIFYPVPVLRQWEPVLSPHPLLLKQSESALDTVPHIYKVPSRKQPYHIHPERVHQLHKKLPAHSAKFLLHNTPVPQVPDRRSHQY